MLLEKGMLLDTSLQKFEDHPSHIEWLRISNVCKVLRQHQNAFRDKNELVQALPTHGGIKGPSNLRKEAYTLGDIRLSPR